MDDLIGFLEAHAAIMSNKKDPTARVFMATVNSIVGFTEINNVLKFKYRSGVPSNALQILWVAQIRINEGISIEQ